MTSRLILALALIITGCSSPPYYVQPREWRTPQTMDSVVASLRPFLAGHSLFLDPGHGGEDRANRGPAGDAIEADVNLRVALALRSLLVRAGATVVLSREKDTSIALAERAPLAASAGAELFVSLHHNATGKGDHITNFSSVFYHARPGHPAFHAANHDIARYIQRDMSYAMRNASAPSSPTFDGTLSDFDIYPNSGFAVLRGATMPAVLVEGSFFTHPHEEQRLALEEFDRIEAWGVFVGLGRYFRAGFPRLDLRSDSVLTPPWRPIAIDVRGEGPFDSSSLDVRFDRLSLGARIDSSGIHVPVLPESVLTSGPHLLTAALRQAGGNCSWPFRRTIMVMLPAESLAVAVGPSAFPAAGSGMVRIICRAFDRYRMPVADGTPIRVAGPGVDTTIATLRGRAYAYAGIHPEVDSIRVALSSAARALTVHIGRSPMHSTWVTGVVFGADDSLPLAGVDVRCLDRSGASKGFDSTFEDGRFVLLPEGEDSGEISVRKDGFSPVSLPCAPGTRHDTVNVYMPPIAGRRLFRKTYLLDARYGGMERGESDTTGLCGADVNLEIALRAAALLRAAGANAVLVRTADSTISEGARIRFSAQFSGGMYVRIDAAGTAGKASCSIYPGSANRRLAGSLLRGLRSSALLDSTGIGDVLDRFHTDVAIGTITVTVPSPRTGAYRGGSAAFEAIARGIYRGAAEAEGGKIED